MIIMMILIMMIMIVMITPGLGKAAPRGRISLVIIKLFLFAYSRGISEIHRGLGVLIFEEGVPSRCF